VEVRPRLAIDPLQWLALSVGKSYQWRQRYGKTRHNGSVPRDFRQYRSHTARI
jgi:hypothetical protein